MLAAVWAIVVALTGGFFLYIGPVRVSSRNPRNAAGVAVLAAIVVAGLSWRPEGRRAAPGEELLRLEAFGVACPPSRRYPRFFRTPTRQAALWLLLVWAVSAVYIYPFVDRGGVPHDEGLLGQSAERVLSGQLPHRDFDETYTGGLSYLHAVAFSSCGVRLISLRYALLVFFLAWIPALFAIARRLTSPPAAPLATWLAVMWAMRYFASMPSWYNLIFATFGFAAIMKYVDGGGRWWLFAAGAAGGASLAIKSAAIYYLVGATLFLTTRELVESAVSTPGSRSYAMLGAKAAVAVLVTIAAIFLVLSRWAASGVCPLHCADCGRLGVVLLGRSALGFARRARARSTAGRNDDSIRARDPPAACRARHPIWTVRIGFGPVARRLCHTAATSGRGQPCPSVFCDASARGSLCGRARGACWTGCVARFPMVRADSRAVRRSAARVGGSDTQLSDSVESDAPPQHRGGARSGNRALACDTSDVAALGQDAGRPVARHGDRVRRAHLLLLHRAAGRLDDPRRDRAAGRWFKAVSPRDGAAADGVCRLASIGDISMPSASLAPALSGSERQHLRAGLRIPD